MRNRRCFLAGIFALLMSVSAYSLTPTIKYSKNFYAAQKYFYAEAKKKFPKLNKEKFYPEVPIPGAISAEELKGIMPLMDFFEARSVFADEVHKYPEQLYPEIFAFLSGHPALKVGPGSKAKFEAIEKYFLPFNYLFCSDKHYAFHSEVKSNPCPIVFYYSDDKKNSISMTLSNSSKKTLNLNLAPIQDLVQLSGKQPITLKAGSSTAVKFMVNTPKLKSDSIFKIYNLVFSDPAQPKIKIMVPLLLLPSKDFLNLPAHFFDLSYNYNSHLKNIDLYKDRTSGPEPCSGNNCNTEKLYLLRSSDRSMTEYKFGEAGTVQYNLCSQSPANFSSKNNPLQVLFNELGSIDGTDRNCPGAIPESSAPCPPETPNNGKQLYGTRKIEMKLFIPEGKKFDLRININYTDLKPQMSFNPELSWLQEKKLVVVITDASKKIIHKEFAVNNLIATQKKELTSGIYTVAIYPTNEDSQKLNPSFEINYLNHGVRARFDFTLKGVFNLYPSK